MLLIPFDPLNCLSYLIKCVGESSKPGRCSRASKTGSKDTFMTVQLGGANLVVCGANRRASG
jgi:hypothetical protein